MWIDHTPRKEITNITRHALEWNQHGHRKRGKPKNTWRRDLTPEAQKIGKTWGEIKKLAKDREEWKATVNGRPMSTLPRTKWIKSVNTEKCYLICKRGSFHPG